MTSFEMEAGAGLLHLNGNYLSQCIITSINEEYQNMA